MENKYFKISDKVYDVCTRYPETINVFVQNGFPQFNDKQLLKQLGKNISIEMILSMRNLNIDTFTLLLIDSIEKNIIETKSSSNDLIKVQGLLPCPVRVPLQGAFDDFVADFEKNHNQKIKGDLKAASMGLDWLIDDLVDQKDSSKIADVFISAGFDMFFDKKLMGRFREQNVFIDSTGLKNLNKDFDNDEICLLDPDGLYSMIGVVPAVFLVNTKELGDRAIPQCWEDLFKPEFKNSVSLPVGDFDLFNSILLHIYKAYGEDGVKNLGECLLTSMHPSQMVKSDRQKKQRPIITIMPYFFTKMIKPGGDMTAVWPKDGAIISPIFMLTKKESLIKSQAVIDFFASKKIGEILSHEGLFPSVHPDVDNRLASDNKFMWLGWDYIKHNDIGLLLKKCETIFQESSKKI